MRLPFPRSSDARCRAPGRRWLGPRRRLRPWPNPPTTSTRTMLASGVGLWSAVLVVCLLSVPGFVLGAQAPSTSVAPGIESTSDKEPETEPPVEATPAIDPEVNEPAPTGEPAEPGTASGTLLAALTWGDGDGQVGLAAPGEGLARGPEAVAVAPDGRLAVLDSVNGRVVVLDAQGSLAGTIPLPLAEPRFLAVTDERLYALDCDRDRRLVGLSWAGEELERRDLPQLEDVVTGLFATKLGPCIEVAHAETYLLKGGAEGLQALPGRPLDAGLRAAAKAVFAPGRGAQVNHAAIDQKTLRATTTKVLNPGFAKGRSLEHLVSLDGDGAGGLIVGARLLVNGPEDSALKDAHPDVPAVVLTRLPAGSDSQRPTSGPAAPAAAMSSEAELLLADCSFAYLGQPYAVTPDGRVIQPVADETGYRLLVHCFPVVEEAAR